MTDAKPIASGWDDVLDLVLLAGVDGSAILDALEREQEWSEGFRIYRRLIASGSRVPLALAASC